MSLLRCFFAVVFALAGSGCSSDSGTEPGVATNPTDGAGPNATSNPTPAVCESLETIKRGEWQGRRFPTVSWGDVDALLASANDATMVARFPQNPFSSESQAECSVGILSLWMIEGIRRGLPGGYPSLNPMLSKSTDAPDLDWIERSERHRAEAAEAYRRWWATVKTKSDAEREALDPLAGTGLLWYGAG